MNHSQSKPRSVVARRKVEPQIFRCRGVPRKGGEEEGHHVGCKWQKMDSGRYRARGGDLDDEEWRCRPVCWQGRPVMKCEGKKMRGRQGEGMEEEGFSGEGGGSGGRSGD